MVLILATAHEICLASLSLTFILALRVAGYPCPVPCEQLRCFWRSQMWELDAHHEALSQWRRSPGHLWLAQVAFQGLGNASLLCQHFLSLKTFWNAVSCQCLRAPAVAAALLTLSRRLVPCAVSEQGVLPQVVYEQLDRWAVRLAVYLVSYIQDVELLVVCLVLADVIQDF